MWMRVTGRPGSIVAAARDQLTGTVGDRVLDRVAAYEGAARGPADERAALDRLDPHNGSGSTVCSPSIGTPGHHAGRTPTYVIDGDPELQLAVRFAIFHLLASAPISGEAAVGARGLSGTAYRGHVFWDTDVFVLPFLAATHPQAARAMLEYRVRRLPAALRAARRSGATGARFPWESARTGRGRDAGASTRPATASSCRSSPASSRSTSSPTSPGPPPATSTGPATRRSPPARGAS